MKQHEPHAKDRMLRYFGIILLFALGAGIGSVSAGRIGGQHAIWISCLLLLASLLALMFIREDLEQKNPLNREGHQRYPQGHRRKSTGRSSRKLKRGAAGTEEKTRLTNDNINRNTLLPAQTALPRRIFLDADAVEFVQSGCAKKSFFRIANSESRCYNVHGFPKSYGRKRSNNEAENKKNSRVRLILVMIVLLAALLASSSD